MNCMGILIYHRFSYHQSIEEALDHLQSRLLNRVIFHLNIYSTFIDHALEPQTKQLK